MMKEKIKVLFISSKKMKKKTTSTTLNEAIERECPGMYEFTYVYGEEDGINQIDILHPDIIFIGQNKQMDSLGLLKKIKQLYPPAVVFIIFSYVVDDEQETIDEYTSAGAYKCFFSTFVFDTLIHDMYVALNLE